MPKPILLFLSFLVAAGTAAAQQRNLPLQQEHNRVVEGELMRQNKPLHSSIRPFLQQEIEDEGVAVDSLMDARYGNTNEPNRSWLYRKLFQEHLLPYRRGNAFITADPLLDIRPGYASGTGLVYTNTIGVQLQGDLTPKLSFYAALYENWSRFPGYLDAYTQERGMAPGQGRASRTNDSRDWLYTLPMGYISYTPSEYFNIQAGHDKLFFGDGYRSLFLSDYAYSYPFFKINTTFWKIKYTNLWTQFVDASDGLSDKPYPKKYASYQYLSFLPSPTWNISLFQAMLWSSRHSGVKGIELAYLNPIIYMNSANFNMGSPGNSMMGLNLRHTFLNRYNAYGQFVIDDLFIEEHRGHINQKYAFQLGLKGFHAFGVQNLYLQAEYNEARPYIHGHRTRILSNTHFNEPLAHPFGANFRELVLTGSYRYKRWEANALFNRSRYGTDSTGANFGKNIFLSEPEGPEWSRDHRTGQGVRTDFIYFRPTLSYLLNPRTHLKLQAGYTFRRESSAQVNNTAHIIYFGIKTDLINRYYDF
ncbi:hypothetical protein [Pontibacter sp. SGAir0037]|uniref:hypothetical protein n=1 Tax=Pontibacter sp. SGAir0037 TaxID=2571030 RepID=UPI0010CCEC3B|nr:hypothetical protein [Pontibacter sp. SGAir0037]QCR20991.1 hypothetical protein C1N53_00490 [Pontibacter sp. SGAir0037]